MSMRDQSRSAAAEEGSQIDLTPMLDVVFIMLIFFIVTSKKEAPQANIVVQVDRETPAYVVEDLIDVVRPILTAPPCISTDEEA